MRGAICVLELRKTLQPNLIDGVELLEDYRATTSILFTTKFPEIPGILSINLGKMKG